MALDSYAGLKAEIADYLDEDNDARIDSFIDIAEARHRREIRIREMRERATLSIAASARYVDLPADFEGARKLSILNPVAGAVRRIVANPDYVNQDQMNEYSTNVERLPCFFTIDEQIEFDSPADQAYSAEFHYFKTLTPLSDSNTSNALLARAPDLYLYAALSASAPYFVNDERIAVWEALYTSGRDELNNQQRLALIPNNVQSRVHGTVR